MNEHDLVQSNSTEEEDDSAFIIAVAFFSARFSVLFVLTVILSIINLVLLLAVTCQKALPGTIRIILFNIIVANGMLILSVFVLSMAELIELYYESWGEAWRVFYVLMVSAAAARLLFMGTYAGLVYVIARYTGSGTSPKIIPLIIACVVIWVLAILPNFIHYLTIAADVSVVVGPLCSAHAQVTFELDYTLISLGLYGIVGFSASIPLLVMTIWHVKSGNKEIRKGLVKFTFFLLFGNATHFLGIMVPLIFSLFNDEECYAFLIAIDSVGLLVLVASLFTTPAIILCFFSNVREKALSILRCTSCKVKRHRAADVGVTMQTLTSAQA